jgi:hypothetical protein
VNVPLDGAGLEKEEQVSDEIRDEETEGTEDVEGHGLAPEPSAGSPSAGRSDDEDGDDVEAHGLMPDPSAGQPNIT